jgi:hypothetical protein
MAAAEEPPEFLSYSDFATSYDLNLSFALARSALSSPMIKWRYYNG